MKLSKIYSNRRKEFEPIIFNIGQDSPALNIVYAQVKKPKDARKDSHNLGKTTLIHLIDFLLLKDISKGHHFLAKHAETFALFDFYLEILLNSGKYLTIKRSVESPTRISFIQHGNQNSDYSRLNDESWDHYNMPLKKSVQMLDSYLNLNVISPWSYRKGVTYFLRAQRDYLDYFQISKFVKGRDIDWKPYLVNLLGFDYKIIQQKYELDNLIEDKNSACFAKQSEVQIDESDYNKLKSKIKIRKSDISKIMDELDSFSFSKEEEKLNKQLVQDIEREVTDINNELYNIEYDISRLQKSISKGVTFRLDEIQKIWDEAELHFPDQLAKDYSELIEFNKKITSERNKSIKSQIESLSQEKDELQSKHKELDNKRKHQLAILRDTDTFNKYKTLQKSLAEHMASQAFLENQLEKLDNIRRLKKEIIELTKKVGKLSSEIQKYTEDSSTILDNIADEFHSLVEKILGLEGLLYVKQNKSGNLEFKIEVERSDEVGKITSQDEGTSYKKLLCVLFDLSILRTYSDSGFFHFVYHDGVFEGLDNRKRLALLDVIREFTTDYNIQYILSVIDADLPRDPDSDEKLYFEKNEVVLSLHDEGQNGRLFKIPKF